jgi:hypothetical protein
MRWTSRWSPRWTAAWTARAAVTPATRLYQAPARGHAVMQWLKDPVVGGRFPDEQYRRGLYLFRGMRSPQWRLKPTFDRVFQHIAGPSARGCSMPCSLPSATPAWHIAPGWFVSPT